MSPLFHYTGPGEGDRETVVDVGSGGDAEELATGEAEAWREAAQRGFATEAPLLLTEVKLDQATYPVHIERRR
ncbi:MAG: hypothetical protein JNK48_18795 [Bryobacterales bacterium]|nr:hypothetical protein [Bryobacterales bacterium]